MAKRTEESRETTVIRSVLGDVFGKSTLRRGGSLGEILRGWPLLRRRVEKLEKRADKGDRTDARHSEEIKKLKESVKTLRGHVSDLKRVDRELSSRVSELEKRVRKLEDQNTRVLATLPLGSVVAWQPGEGQKLPQGWKLCDGRSGRPNLLGKFVRGCRKGDVGKEGGDLKHDHGAVPINTSFSVTIPKKSVTRIGLKTSSGCFGNPQRRKTGGIDVADYKHGHGTITGSASGQAQVGEVEALPPYYSLVYIIKVAHPYAPPA